MNIVDRLEYSNIQEYRIGDTECENLVLKALQCGIGNIVIGSSALDLVSDMLEKENNDDIKINSRILSIRCIFDRSKSTGNRRSFGNRKKNRRILCCHAGWELFEWA